MANFGMLRQSGLFIVVIAVAGCSSSTGNPGAERDAAAGVEGQEDARVDGATIGPGGAGGTAAAGGTGNTGGTAASGGASSTAAVNCGPPPTPPVNGSVQALSSTYGSTATYSCSTGYLLSGGATRFCQADGTWSGIVPTCVISCPSGETACTGICGDTQTDNANCGGCGVVCSAISPSTARCTAGRCLTTLATSDHTKLGIAVNASNVYWTVGSLDGSATSGTIMKMSLAGGTPTTLASEQKLPLDIAADASSVYWTNSGTGLSSSSLMKVPLAGGAPTTLASGQSYYDPRIVVDATSVYWIDLGPTAFGGGGKYVTKSVMKVPLAGGTPTTLASDLLEKVGIAVDPTCVYWTTTTSIDASPYDGTVMKVSLAGGSPTTLVSGLSGPADMAVDATSVYWIDSSGMVMKVSLAGGTPTTLASDQNSPSDIAVDTRNIYWINSGTFDGNNYVDGTVMKMPLAGGIPTTLASGLTEAYEIAVDDSSVYWIADVGGISAVMKLTPK